MKKLSRLIRVLRKCGHSGDKNQTASSAVGDNAVIIKLMVILGLAGGMFYIGHFLAQRQALFGDGTAIFNTIMMLAAMFSLCMSIPTMINQLYMSGDLDVLVSMPFTPMQIVTAKLVNAGMMPLGICCGMTIPTGIGFGLTAGGTGVMYWVSLLLGALMLSITACSLAGLIVILVMRFFRRIRSRNVIAVITALFTFGVTAAYFAFTGSGNSISEEKLAGIFQAIQASMGGVARVIPMIGLSVDAMFTAGEGYKLLLAMAATGVTVILLLLAAKYLYFAAALGMQDANAARAKLTDGQLNRATRASSVRKAMIRREFRSVLRIPAMINTGYLQSYILPLMLFIPMILQIVGGEERLEALRTVVTQLPVGTILIAMELITALFVSSGVGMSSISSGIISREGKDYYALKAMPVKMRTIVAAKHRVAALINCVPAVVYPVILAVVCSALGIAPFWSAAAAVVFGIPFLSLMISVCALWDVKKPNLNWENEADVCKSNNVGVIIFIVILFGCIGAAFLLVQLKLSEVVTLLVSIAVLAASVIGAVLCYLRLMKAADELPGRY